MRDCWYALTVSGKPANFGVVWRKTPVCALAGILI